MKLRKLRDFGINSRIFKARENSDALQYYNLLVERFDGFDFQEIGGTVRDAVISSYYSTPTNAPRDFDFVLDDSAEEIDLFEICKNLPGEVGRNNFGNVKWKIEKFEFDVAKYSPISPYALRNSRSLEGWLRDCDFNLGAIAYDESTGEITSFGAFEGIGNRRISLMRPETNRPEASIVRAFEFERRLNLPRDLGFKIDGKTLDWIRETYTPEMDGAILEYAKYKKIPNEVYQDIISKLGKFCQIGDSK